MTSIEVSFYAKEWIKGFKKVHLLKSDKEAVDKLIEIHKAWNRRIE